MFKRYLLSGAVAVMCSAAMTSAQTPATGAAPQVPPAGQQTPATTQPRPTSPQTTTTDRAAPTTLVGCLVREQDVPGHAPNIAERAGIMEDYILAEITPAEAARPAGTSGASRVPTTYSMYKLEKAKDSELKSMVAKRVEVIGRIDAEKGDAVGQPSASTDTSKTDRVIGRDRIDLPEFEVSSIRAVAGTCPAKPSTAR